MIDNSKFEIDGTTYIVVKTIKDDDVKYVYLVNENNQNDFLINKEIIEDEKNYLVNLDNEEEFTKAMLLYANNK